jgi:hypothetical protein
MTIEIGELRPLHVPKDVLEYINKTWDVRVLVRSDSYTKETLRGIQMVVDSLNQINTEEY